MKSAVFGSIVLAATVLLSGVSVSATPMSIQIDIDALELLLMLLMLMFCVAMIDSAKLFSKVNFMNKGLRNDLEKNDRKVTFFAPTNEVSGSLLCSFHTQNNNHILLKAWKDIEKVMDNIRGDRNLDNSENRKRNRDDDRKKIMENILQYHIVRDQINYKDLYNSQLLQSELRERNLVINFKKS
ncbi:hypothetical protein HK096_007152 [Nowakowskiella sp. JEL0078]|nr:hypothetical protein HK096_007152 [Nowakowskiella sp. JEL0078]